MGTPRYRNDLTIYTDRVAAWWDHRDPIFEPLHALVPARLAFLERHLPEWRGCRVLDVGCGGGYMSEAIARKGALVVGVDRAEGALVAARRHAEAERLPITYLHASADDLPFPDRSFDRVLCTDVLVHVPDPASVVREIGRVLKPGGAFFYSTMNRTRWSRLVMISLAEDLLGVVHRGTHDPARFIRPEELAEMMASAGISLGPREGIGPVGLGWSRGPRLRFGRASAQALMYQGLGVRGAGLGAPAQLRG